MKNSACQEENLISGLKFSDGLKHELVARGFDFRLKVASDFCRANGLTVDIEKFNVLEKELVLKFSPKKIQSLMLSRSYRRLGHDEKKLLRIEECGSFLGFARKGVIYKLKEANFCTDRLCPLCSWRRSLKTFSQVKRVVDVLGKDYDFIYLTLTIKNVAGSELPSAIDVLKNGWHKLSRSTRFKSICKGYFKALEVTYRQKRDDFHPHLHAIIAVERDYFNPSNYIKQADLVKMWQRALRVDYLPGVYMQKCRDKNSASDDNKERSMGSVIAEVATYSVKSSDFLLPDIKKRDEVVNFFHSALFGRRLCSWGGVFKETRAKLGLDDVESGDLIKTGDEISDDDIEEMLYYGWHYGYGAYKLLPSKRLVDVDIECDECEKPP